MIRCAIVQRAAQVRWRSNEVEGPGRGSPFFATKEEKRPNQFNQPTNPKEEKKRNRQTDSFPPLPSPFASLRTLGGAQLRGRREERQLHGTALHCCAAHWDDWLTAVRCCHRTAPLCSRLSLSLCPSAPPSARSPRHSTPQPPPAAAHQPTTHSRSQRLSPTVFPLIPPAAMSSMKIEEVKSSEQLSRIATHTHIRGLGVRDDGTVIPIAAGLVGQEAAREVRTSQREKHEARREWGDRRASARMASGALLLCLLAHGRTFDSVFFSSCLPHPGRCHRCRSDSHEEDGRKGAADGGRTRNRYVRQ